MVSHLQHANPDSTVLMVGILPCAAETSPGPKGLFAWPNGLSAGISRVNTALEGFASQHHFVQYVDCTDEMLLQGQVRHQADSGNLRVSKRLCFCMKGCCCSLLCILCARGCCKWPFAKIGKCIASCLSTVCSASLHHTYGVGILTSCVEHL